MLELARVIAVDAAASRDESLADALSDLSGAPAKTNGQVPSVARIG
jgi:hypothetical protein